jgi:threonylcarbamoyladenosine tRNA methylthiotransferase MtaB
LEVDIKSMKRISFYTLGCKVNQSDTASMEKLFQDAGYTIVPFDEPSDICLINTCVVTNVGQGKSRRMIRRTAKRDPKPLIVVTGCYPQTSPDEVASLEGVDLMVGTQDRKRIVELVESRLKNEDQKPYNDVQELPKGRAFEDMEAAVDESRDRAFLKIQEGCDQYCAYCIIPYARGHLRSRSLESIRREVQRLTGEGYKEIVLIGIHLGCYGKENPDGPRLSDAVKAALSVPDVTRIRLGSLESVEVEDELLDLMMKDHRLCAHLHLPLQAGCDKTLKNMHRPYDTAKFAALLKIIRARVPHVAITTDVIVGFPGETEEDFEASLHFCDECGFSKIHIFPYSRRQGTPAAAMKEQLSNKEKQDRVHRLEVIDAKGNKAYRESIIGLDQDVLWERRNEEGNWEGFTPGYVRVYCDTPREDLEGKITRVHLEKLFEDGLKGDII